VSHHEVTQRFPAELLRKILAALPAKFYALKNPQKSSQFSKIVVLDTWKLACTDFEVDKNGVGTLTIHRNAWRNKRLFVLTVLHALGHNWAISIKSTNPGLYKKLVAETSELKAVIPYVWPLPPGDKAGRRRELFAAISEEPLAEAFMLYVGQGQLLRIHMHRLSKHKDKANAHAAWKALYQELKQDLGRQFNDWNFEI